MKTLRMFLWPPHEPCVLHLYCVMSFLRLCQAKIHCLVSDYTNVCCWLYSRRGGLLWAPTDGGTVPASLGRAGFCPCWLSCADTCQYFFTAGLQPAGFQLGCSESLSWTGRRGCALRWSAAQTAAFTLLRRLGASGGPSTLLLWRQQLDSNRLEGWLSRLPGLVLLLDPRSPRGRAPPAPCAALGGREGSGCARGCGGLLLTPSGNRAASAEKGAAWPSWRALRRLASANPCKRAKRVCNLCTRCVLHTHKPESQPRPGLLPKPCGQQVEGGDCPCDVLWYLTWSAAGSSSGPPTYCRHGPVGAVQRRWSRGWSTSAVWARWESWGCSAWGRGGFRETLVRPSNG